MTLPPALRKATLAAHLVVSVGWVGAVVAYLALGLAAETSRDTDTVRSAWTGMEITGWAVVVPLALASLVTGLVMALGTQWGLLRHYWVVFSFGLTVVAAVVLLLHMPTVSSQADLAREADGSQLADLGGDILHPGIGLVLLLVVHVLNVFKPRGLTPYGQRKLREQRPGRDDHRTPTPSSSTHASAPGR